LTIQVEVPRKLQPLLHPKRYKGAYGGRGGAKSHFFAEQVILRCYVRSTRVVCIREIQDSIKDSVKQLLTDKITKLGLEEYFKVLDTEIRGPNDSIIIFKGMQSYNAANIKSLESYDIAWVEEAQTLSQNSLRMLRPTLRKAGSELWFSWNPRYKTDPVDQFFRKNPPDNAIAVAINWQDNPWFKNTELYKDMLNDYENDPDEAEHVWGGAYGAGQGAILSRWVNKAERDGRINNDVTFDPNGAPIEVSSDIGFRDTASWWYWQPKVRGYSILKYEGDSGFDADDWIPVIQQNLLALGNVKLGKIWLPPDSKAKTFQSKHSSMEKFLMAFSVEHIGATPPSKKPDQISASRRVIEFCEFNKDACEDGLDGLRAWEFEYNEDNNMLSREPLHNWASHPSDAFCYGCQVMTEHHPVNKKPVTPLGLTENKDGSFSLGVSLNDMWNQQPINKGRI
jgi:phage terminase large subunit